MYVGIFFKENLFFKNHKESADFYDPGTRASLQQRCKNLGIRWQQMVTFMKMSRDDNGTDLDILWTEVDNDWMTALGWTPEGKRTRGTALMHVHKMTHVLVFLLVLSQSMSPSLCSTCPTQFHRHLLSSSIIAFVSTQSVTSLFVIICCHLIHRILCKHLNWSASIVFSCLCKLPRFTSVYQHWSC